MIIRIRSNLGMWKLTLDDSDTTLTIEDLKIRIFNEFKFSTEATPEQITLSSQMAEGNGVFSDSSCTLHELDLKHGGMIFITSKLKQIIIENSFVGEDGNMVEAGTKISIEDVAPARTVATPCQVAERDDNTVFPPPATLLPSAVTSPPATSTGTNHSLQATEEPTMTDEEAIAKLMEEDLNSAAAANSSSSLQPDSQHYTPPPDMPDLRAPDLSKNMRLFDPHEDDTDMHYHEYGMGGNRGMHMDVDMASIMSQFLDPGARATATHRHGREPLRTLADTRPKVPNPTKQKDFEAPKMNQEVVDNARAAGLSEEEIQEMFDVEYAERLQANVLANDLDGEKDQDVNIRATVGGVTDVFVRHRNQYEDLTLDDDDEEDYIHGDNKVDQLTKTMNSLSNASLGGRNRTDTGEDFMSQEEERLIQEILASSLAEAESQVKEDKEKEEEEEEEWEQAQKQIVFPDYTHCREDTWSDGLGVVGRPYSSTARGGAGSSSRQEQRKLTTPKTYPKVKKVSNVNVKESTERPHSITDNRLKSNANESLSMEGRRMDVDSQSQSLSQVHVSGAQKGRSSAPSSAGRLHGRGVRVPPRGGAVSSVPTAHPTSMPLPVSEVSIQRSARSSLTSSRTTTPAQREALPSSEGEGEALNDSMDDEVMAWALKMSAVETGGATVSAPTSNRNSPSSTGSTHTTSSPHRTEHTSSIGPNSRRRSANTTPRSSSKGLPEPHGGQTEGRSAASEKAEKLLQRLNAELHTDMPTSSATGGGGYSASGLERMDLVPPAQNPNYVAPQPSVGSGSGRSDRSDRSDRSGSGRGKDSSSSRGSTGSGSGSNGSSSSSSSRRRPRVTPPPLSGGGGGAAQQVQVSDMDEDEQLAWAIQQSMQQHE